MNVIQGDLHDPLSATFQTLELARLNDALRECGVADAQLRRQICQTCFGNSGYFYDSCWFREEGRRFRPGIYFAQLDDAGEETGDVFMPDPEVGSALHEYAHGAAAWLFDDHAEDASEIETGDINL